VSTAVADNASALEYEITIDGEPAGLIRYTRDGDVITLVHTEVEPKFEGHGVGSTLIQGALDDIRAHGRRVRPVCPFVRAYLERHPEYADLVED
jgi:predicted GNAT family acetyltransferase